MESKKNEKGIAYSKLLRMEKDSDDREVDDFSSQRVADFEEIRHEGSVASSFSQSKDVVDKLFGNDAARRI